MDSTKAMTSCDEFSVVLVDTTGAVSKARQMVTSHGGSFVGDDKFGVFTGVTPVGAIHGEYSVQSESIAVTITSKPWLVPCTRIEEEVRRFFT